MMENRGQQFENTFNQVTERNKAAQEDAACGFDPRPQRRADLDEAKQRIEKTLGFGDAPTRASTLPTDAKGRKEHPVASGVLDYFPDALVAVANVSFRGNEQHNPGQPLHWAREKSTDQDDTIIRHFLQRGSLDTDGIRHSAKMVWRALALLQLEIEAEQKTCPQYNSPTTYTGSAQSIAGGGASSERFHVSESPSYPNAGCSVQPAYGTGRDESANQSSAGTAVDRLPYLCPQSGKDCIVCCASDLELCYRLAEANKIRRGAAVVSREHVTKRELDAAGFDEGSYRVTIEKERY